MKRLRSRSLRARLVISTVCSSGVVLVLFALVTWHTVRTVSLDRVDAEIANHIRPQLSRPDDPGRWEGFDAALSTLYTQRQSQAHILLVKDGSDRVLWRSAQWPSAIPATIFPPPRPDDPRLRFWAPPPAGGPPPLPPDGRRPPRTVPAGGPLEMWPPRPLPTTEPTFTSRTAAGVHWRLGTVSNGRTRVVLGLSLTALDAGMARMRNGFIAALLAALGAIAAASWWLSGRSLRPLERLADTAEAVTAANLDQRLDTRNTEAELQRLVTVFNEMLDRLERSFNQAVRFSADAAHELQTPLTILQGELEQLLQSTDPDADHEALANLLDEVQRLKTIVRKLLLLARVDAGAMHPALQPLNLSEAVTAAVEDAQEMAPELTVAAEVAPAVWVMADADLLRQVLTNLIGNALKYNRAEGTVTVQLRGEGAQARLSVTNTGPAIAPGDRARVFDRFYRADPARSRGVDGLGLGLSLSREIARLHGGEVVLQSSTPEATVFVLTLPLGVAAGT
jgi:two-component system heavy metal sensor histidine kinase CusS